MRSNRDTFIDNIPLLKLKRLDAFVPVYKIIRDYKTAEPIEAMIFHPELGDFICVQVDEFELIYKD